MAEIILTDETRLAIEHQLAKNAARQAERQAKKRALKKAHGAYVYDPLKNHK